MRSAFAFSALAALAAAAPAANPQEINASMVAAAPDISYSQVVGATATAQIVSYDATSLAAQATTAVGSVSVAETDVASATEVAKRGINARDACATQITGAAGAPTVSPDTPSAFVSNTAFAAAASAAPVPAGYSNTFTNLQASNNAYGYLGYTTLQTYDTASCAAQCNAINGCMSINIYYERDPASNPSTCANTASATLIKCVFWGGPVDSTNANNVGQTSNGFQTVIAGSNGYTNDTLIVPSGFTEATYYGGAAINAPYDAQGYDTFMGSTIFTGGPFNATLCALHCESQNAYNLATAPTDGTPVKICNFFNTFLIYEDTTANMQGQYCSMYTEAWPASYAVNTGYYWGSHEFFVEYSYGFTNASSAGYAPTTGNKVGAIYQAKADIAWSSLQPFCSSYLGYTQPATTVYATSTAHPLTTSSAYSTTTSVAVSTSTVYATVTVNALQKRQDSGNGTTTTSAASAASSSSTTGLFPYEDDSIIGMYVNGSYIYANASTTTTAANKLRRALSTPDVLTKYPATVISSACSLEVTQATVTSTISSTSITSAAVSTVHVTSTVTITTASTTSTTSYATATVTSGVLYGSGSGTGADGAQLQYDSESTSVGSATYFNIEKFDKRWNGVGYTLDATTGYLWTADGSKIVSIANTDFRSGALYEVFVEEPAQGYNPLICSVSSGALSCKASDSKKSVVNSFALVQYTFQSAYYQGLFLYNQGVTTLVAKNDQHPVALTFKSS